MQFLILSLFFPNPLGTDLKFESIFNAYFYKK